MTNKFHPVKINPDIKLLSSAKKHSDRTQ